MRVQRTPSSPSGHPSALTRYALGGARPLVLALLCIGVSCSTAPHQANPPPPSFGVVNAKAPVLPAGRLAEVNEAMSVGDIFSILGPAVAYSEGGRGFDTTTCPADSRCWCWGFDNGVTLGIPVEANPGAKPRAFMRFRVVSGDPL